MGDPNSRKKQALNRLRAQLRKKKESLADQFDFKMYIAFVFKDKVTWFLNVPLCLLRFKCYVQSLAAWLHQVFYP